MASLTATADGTYAHVGLYVDFDAFVTQNQVTIVRIHSDGTEHAVRGAYRIVTFPVTFDYFLFDTEAPLDTAVTYRAFEDVDGQDPAVNTVTSGSVTIGSNGYHWFKDPSRPWADIRADDCAQQGGPCAEITEDVSLFPFGDRTRGPDANLVPVLDRELPADIWARRKGITSSMSFLSRTLAAIDRVYTLFTAGGPLLLQIQPLFGWPDAYWQPLDLVETRTGSADQRNPLRRWTAPITQVDRPSPASAAQGTVCANWCLIEDTYTTSQDLADTGFTWLEVASCDAVPSFDGYGYGGYGDGPYGDPS